MSERDWTDDQVKAMLARIEARTLDRIYVTIIDTCGFLRGNGDVCELAANRLIKLVPEEFDDREETVRALIATNGPDGR